MRVRPHLWKEFNNKERITQVKLKNVIDTWTLKQKINPRTKRKIQFKEYTPLHIYKLLMRTSNK